MGISRVKLASYIDHTVLKMDATEEEINTLCREAVEWQMGAVCVNPCWVPTAVTAVENSGVKVVTVIGFPLGAASITSKANEAREAVLLGATEVDMVMNLGALKSGSIQYVVDDIRAVVQSVKEENPSSLVKVIIEACYLNQQEKVLACQLAVQGGADFVKTSTGFGSGGATTEDVRLMKEAVGQGIGIKASGGIRDLATGLAMIEAGADRLGTSSGLKLLQELGE